MSPASEIRRWLWLLFVCGFLSLFPRFLLLLLRDTGADCLRVDFEDSGSGAQWIVILTVGCSLGGPREHCIEDEHCQSSGIRLLVKCPGLLGHLIIAGVFRILQTMPLCKAAKQFVWQGAQREARNHPH